MCVYIYMYIYMCVHIYIYIYIYTGAVFRPLTPGALRVRAPAGQEIQRRENMVGVNMVLAEFIQCLRALCQAYESTPG